MDLHLALSARPLRPALAALLIGVPVWAGGLHAQEADGSTALQAITVRGGDDDRTSTIAHDASSGTKTTTPLLDTPSAISVVTQKAVEQRAVTNLQDVLSYTVGVTVDDYGSDDRYDYYRIRGFSETETGTYIDGLPVRGAGWTFQRLQPYGFDRFEVVKGSNSALFGLNAPGGLVNAITKQPQALRFGSAYTTFGDGRSEVGADFGAPIDRDGVWSYRVTTKVQNGGTGAEYSRDKQRYLGLALRYQPDSATRLTILGSYSARDTSLSYDIPAGTGLDPDTFLGEPDFNHNKGTARSLGWLFEHDFGNGLTLRQNARYMWFRLGNNQVYPSSADPTADREAFAVDGRNRQFAVDTRLQYDTTIGNARSRTLVGVEYDWFKEHEVSEYGSAPGLGSWTDPSFCGLSCITLGPYLDWRPALRSTALYLQEELTFNDRWILTLGGRYDRLRTEGFDANYDMATRHDSHVSKRLGLTYKITPDLSAYANYSESFQPNFWNVDEGPKKGRQYEAGLKYRPAGINGEFNLAAFDLTQSNVSTYVSPTVLAQIGKVRVRGIELEGKTQLTDRIALQLAYSYWDAKIVEDGSYGTDGGGGNKGNRPSFVPNQVASVWANYTLPGTTRRGAMTFGVGARFLGSRYSDDANTIRKGGYTVFDAMYRYQMSEHVALGVNVSNLFDLRTVTATYGGEDYYNDERRVAASLYYTW